MEWIEKNIAIKNDAVRKEMMIQYKEKGKGVKLRMRYTKCAIEETQIVGPAVGLECGIQRCFQIALLFKYMPILYEGRERGGDGGRVEV